MLRKPIGVLLGSAGLAMIGAQLLALAALGALPASEGARTLVLSAALVLAGVVFDPTGSRPLAWCPAWCGVLAAGAFLAGVSTGTGPGVAELAARSAAGVGSLSLALCGAQRLLGGIGGRDRARVALLALVAGMGAAPLWLGPLAEAAGTRFANALVWSSPLTYLSEICQQDVLRSAWLYAHSPLGSVRIDPPMAAPTSVVYLTLGAVMLGGAKRFESQRN